MKAWIVLSLFLVCNSVLAQKKSPASSTDPATVDILVKDGNGNPRKGEMIVLQSLSSNLRKTGRTDAHGRAVVSVADGYDYSVTVKALVDSNQYGLLQVPKLKEGETFNGNFSVEIVYEPAKSFTLNNVEYDVGKATLRKSSFEELNELVEYLKWKDNQRIEIGGHTDNTGTVAGNQKLSQQRAEAVRIYLLSKGIKPALVVAKGYGASVPIADNATAEGKQKNRRTEVKLLD